MKTYLLALVLFTCWVVGLMYYDVSAAIHSLPLLAMFMIAMAQSRRKKDYRPL